MGETRPIIIKIGQVALNGNPQHDRASAKLEDKTVRETQSLQEVQTLHEINTGSAYEDGSVDLQASALLNETEEQKIEKSRNALRFQLQTAGARNRFNRDRQLPRWGDFPRRSGEKRGKMWWAYPALMGVTTGVAIGFGFLILFKSISFDQVAPVSAMPDSGIRSQLNLSGFSIWMDQVGSFKEKFAADQQAGQLKFLGVESVARGTSPFQLLAGVSGTKASNSGLLNFLKQKSVNVYVKPYVLEDAKLDLIGFPQKEADQLSSLLNTLSKTASTELAAADQSIPLTNLALPDKNQVDGMIASLRKAGHPQAAITLDQLYGNVLDAASQLKTPLNESSNVSAEKNLTAFYVGYERIRSELTHE